MNNGDNTNENNGEGSGNVEPTPNPEPTPDPKPTVNTASLVVLSQNVRYKDEALYGSMAQPVVTLYEVVWR